MTKKMHYAAVEGFLFGRYRKIDEPVGMLDAEEAKYPKQMGQITDTAPSPTAPAGGKGTKKIGEGEG